MFAAALRRKYGAAIFRAVSKEICLRPEPGEELPARVQERAEHMARTAQTVLSGMDFFTRMQLSPVLRPPAFMQACIELGLRPSAITQAQCDAAQQLLDQSFEDAAARHESPISMEQGMQWLKQALRRAAGTMTPSSDADTPLDGAHQATANEADHADDPAAGLATEDPIRRILRKRG
jgi:hypothetical protein